MSSRRKPPLRGKSVTLEKNCVKYKKILQTIFQFFLTKWHFLAKWLFLTKWRFLTERPFGEVILYLRNDPFWRSEALSRNEKKCPLWQSDAQAKWCFEVTLTMTSETRTISNCSNLFFGKIDFQSEYSHCACLTTCSFVRRVNESSSRAFFYCKRCTAL